MIGDWGLGIGEMINDLNESITFRMRIGKKLEFIFGAIWFLGITAFLFWINWTGTKLEIGSGSLFLMFLSLLSLTFVIIFGLSIVRSRLVLSASGISFQGPFKSMACSWEKVGGLYVANGEMYLSTNEQDVKKNPLGGIPVSWFAKFSYKKGRLKPNRVIEAIQRFAPPQSTKPDADEAAPVRGVS